MKKLLCFLFVLFACASFNILYANTNISVSSKSAVAMDLDSGIVLYSKNLNQKVYPASTTKILTAILAIENLDLNKSVTVSKTALEIPWDSSSIYLKKGEILTVEELLYGLLLNSGNDAANVLAEAVAHDIPSFVEIMNKKVKEIGCTNTHFNNAHGYSDDNHYTTALDMAKILSYCVKNDTFVKIFSTKSYIINETNKTKEKRYLSNTNRLIQTKEDSQYARYYKYCIGGKTGYTDEAGRTLVTYAKKDSKNIIVTIFGASSNSYVDVRYTDAINLFEYSFNNFEKVLVAESKNFNYNYINMNKRLKYNVMLKDDLEILAKSNADIKELSYNINIYDNKLNNYNIDSQINDEIVGKISFNITLNDETSAYSFDKPLYLNKIDEYTYISTDEVVNKIELILITCIISIVIILTTYIVLIVIIKKNRKISNDRIKKLRRINKKHPQV